jgi:hypothetical protein
MLESCSHCSAFSWSVGAGVGSKKGGLRGGAVLSVRRGQLSPFKAIGPRTMQNRRVLMALIFTKQPDQAKCEELDQVTQAFGKWFESQNIDKVDCLNVCLAIAAVQLGSIADSKKALNKNIKDVTELVSKFANHQWKKRKNESK